jgi:hypothetical protein
MEGRTMRRLARFKHPWQPTPGGRLVRFMSCLPRRGCTEPWAARMHMQTPVLLTAIALLLICGCAGDKEMRFTKGTGDMGQFVMQQALKRGARPVATNSLPALRGDWSYSEDQLWRRPASSP